MQVFVENRQFDRRQVLNEAQRARSRGRYNRAIALYQYLLAAEPENVELAGRLAPLLAFVGRNFEAWRHFRTAGKALLAQSRPEWALAIFREATACLPHEFEAWRISAELERKLGRRDMAYETLLEGRRQFSSPMHRDQAIAMLELAREIEPWDPDAVIDLAHLFARTSQVGRALDLLDRLAAHSSAANLRRVRAAQWKITWSPHHLWLVLTAIGSAGRGRDEDDSEPEPWFDTATGWGRGFR